MCGIQPPILPSISPALAYFVHPENFTAHKTQALTIVSLRVHWQPVNTFTFSVDTAIPTVLHFIASFILCLRLTVINLELRNVNMASFLCLFYLCQRLFLTRALTIVVEDLTKCANAITSLLLWFWAFVLLTAGSDQITVLIQLSIDWNV